MKSEQRQGQGQLFKCLFLCFITYTLQQNNIIDSPPYQMITCKDEVQVKEAEMILDTKFKDIVERKKVILSFHFRNISLRDANTPDRVLQIISYSNAYFPVSKLMGDPRCIVQYSKSKLQIIPVCFKSEEIADEILAAIKFIENCRHPQREKKMERIRNCWLRWRNKKS
jgi:hypothetical protein